MTSYPHDPEFPFLVITPTGNQVAKFADRTRADRYSSHYLNVVVDTTPKPRIPVDAKFLTITAVDKTVIAIRGELGWKVIGDGHPFWFSDESFEASFRDAEITVLDPRKEES